MTIGIWDCVFCGDELVRCVAAPLQPGRLVAICKSCAELALRELEPPAWNKKEEDRDG